MNCCQLNRFVFVPAAAGCCWLEEKGEEMRRSQLRLLLCLPALCSWHLGALAAAAEEEEENLPGSSAEDEGVYQDLYGVVWELPEEKEEEGKVGAEKEEPRLTEEAEEDEEKGAWALAGVQGRGVEEASLEGPLGPLGRSPRVLVSIWQLIWIQYLVLEWRF